MNSRSILGILVSLCAFGLTTGAHAQVLNIQERASALVGTEAAELCLNIQLDPTLVLAPVAGLTSTDGYGSDQASQDFAWAVMVLGGRALAGDDDATRRLTELLLEWANNASLYQTEISHDSYFALKRTLLPAINAYATIRDGLPADERATIDAWFQGLVSKIDAKFDGDVDLNNHRYLADSVLAAWGALVNDPQMIENATDRLNIALLEQLRPDGSWPLETRRGARALWYTRQSLASLSSIAAALQTTGNDPFADPQLAAQYDNALRYFLDGVRAPSLVIRYAAENYIPGPSDDYTQQDLSFLQTRPHGRNYMAFALLARRLTQDPILQDRLLTLIEKADAPDMPLLDEFSGGNATCFWGLIRG